MPLNLAPLQLALDKANHKYPAEIDQLITINHNQIVKVQLSYQGQILIDGNSQELHINQETIGQLINQHLLKPDWAHLVQTTINEYM